MPCYGRPLRTAWAIGSIQMQNMTDFEAIIGGDCCPYFDNVVMISGINDDGRFLNYNLSHNYGACGYHLTNIAIQTASGKYFIFLGNDDLILPTHFENYLSEIEGTDLDFVWFPWVSNQGRPYRFRLKSWKIGHAGLIIRTDFLKRMPPHEKDYNHDWSLVANMIKAGAKYKKGNDRITYLMDPYCWRGTGRDGDAATRTGQDLRWHSRMAKSIKKLLGL